MWQRIQTLYLAIATILIGSLLFSSVARIVLPDGGVEKIMYHEKVEYLLFLILLVVIHLTCLFLFKARLTQMRLCVIAALVLLAFQIWLGVDYFRHMKEMVFSITAVFPAICMVLDILASRNILLDEAMVQSASRIRASRRARRR